VLHAGCILSRPIQLADAQPHSGFARSCDISGASRTSARMAPAVSREGLAEPLATVQAALAFGAVSTGNERLNRDDKSKT
jgi:hypothetical protein